MRQTVLTSEAVTAAHPDKTCDRISDAIVDACLAADRPVGCVAECAIASGIVFLSLRHGGTLDFDPVALARQVLAETAGTGLADGAAGHSTVMLDALEDASLGGPEAGADRSGADRMTTAFGYACDHTPALMPLPITAAHAIAHRLQEAGTGAEDGWLSPDAQVQVAVRLAGRRPVEIAGVALTLFVGGGEGGAPAAGRLEDRVRGEIVDPALAALGWPPGDAARFTLRTLPGQGGPAAHSGLTGRKTADDTYGGAARQSGSALSGKDPSRIDRTAAYAARQVAVSLVGAGLCRECEVQLSYVPGEAEPASVEVDSFGTGTAPDDALSDMVRQAVDLRAGAIAGRLGLWDLPRRHAGRFYRTLSSYGHFGRTEPEPPWETPLPLG